MPQMPGSGLFPNFPPKWPMSIGLPHWWDYAWWTIVVVTMGGLWRLFTVLAIEVDLDNSPDAIRAIQEAYPTVGAKDSQQFEA